ncbi:hypothetical protein P9139_07555 [Curtobacterium flaccumfaciens]|nr:hypothetical protein P9139_07555 [Curtobacterium flaccumfaciens]
MFSIGWRVYRERLPGLVGQHRLRRAVLVGVIVTVIVFAALLAGGTLLGRLDGSVPVLAGVVVALFLAAGVGCVGAALTPIGPRGWEIPPVPGIGWRTQEAVARYYRRNSPPIDPRHRDAVLDRVPETRDMLVRSTFRSLFLLGGLLGISAGTLVFDFASAAGSSPVVLFPGVWVFPLLINGGTGIVGLRTLGRQEQLRAEAEVLPPVPPPPPARGRPGTPNGSKLSLPGE